MSERETPDVVLIGNITHDITEKGPKLGGTVSFGAHTAVAFGLRVGVLTSAARDEPLLNDLPGEVDVVSIPAEHTTTFDNQYTAAGRVQYLYHRALTLTPAMLPEAWRKAPIVFFGPIAYEIDPAMTDEFGSASICVTPQGWMRRREADGRVITVPWAEAEQVLSKAALTVLSKEDIQHDPGLETVFAGMTPLMVITDGMHGGTIYLDGETRRFPAIEIEQVDPTGAGDIFATVLHIVLAQSGDLDRAIQIAAYLAGLSVSRTGFASAPTPDEIAEAFQRYPA